MKGLFQYYFINSKFAIAGKALYGLAVVALVILAIVMQDVDHTVLLILMPLGSIALMNTDTFFSRYVRVMPIRTQTYVLFTYMIDFVSWAIGALVSAGIVWALSRTPTPHFHFILIYGGYILACSATTHMLRGVKHHLGVVLGFILPAVLAYLVLTPAVVHRVMRDRFAGYPIFESDLFATTRPFAIYALLCLGIFVLSYFVTVHVYRKQDYCQGSPWLKYM